MIQQRFCSLYLQCKQALCILLVFSLPVSSLKAQNNNIDSLQKILNTTKEDTALASVYVAITEELYASNIDTVIPLCLKAIKIIDSKLAKANSTEKKSFLTTKAKALNNIGYVHMQRGNVSRAIEWFQNSAKINEEIGDKQGLAGTLGNIGFIYNNQGDIPKALEWFLKSLKIQEEIGDKQGIANSQNSIGGIYQNQGDITKALEWFKKSLRIYEKTGDKHGIATVLNNIALIYFTEKDIPKALEYYNKSLNIYKEIGNKQGIANLLNNIGQIYFNQGELSQAVESLNTSLKIYEEIKDKRNVAKSLNNLGAVYLKQAGFSSTGLEKRKLLKQAEEYSKRSLQISRELGYPEKIRNASQNLSEIYKTMANLSYSSGNMVDAANRYKDAVEMQVIFKQMADSINNIETRKSSLKKQLQYEFEMKENSAKAEQDKKDIIVIADQNKQRFVLILVICVLFIVFLFAAFIFRSLRITRKQKQIIEIKSTETEQQKKIIEERNKDITDSIHYAKRIQHALLRDEEHTSMHLPEHFILFLPKDIVSGDFYWGTEKNEYWYFAAVDCTGHGVPGAVMSMLGISFLNDIVSSEQLLNPAEVLDRLRDKVVKELRQTGEAGGSKDGMDISIARLNLTTHELQWAGANNSLIFIRNGELEEIKANKQPIGYHPENSPYTNHEIQLQKGDSIYIFSDGFADQFGGPNGKKLTSKKLKNLLIIHNYLPMKEQKELLKKRFTEWKGTLEQIDDVCVFGVRV